MGLETDGFIERMHLKLPSFYAASWWGREFLCEILRSASHSGGSWDTKSTGPQKLYCWMGSCAFLPCGQSVPTPIWHHIGEILRKTGDSRENGSCVLALFSPRETWKYTRVTSSLKTDAHTCTPREVRANPAFLKCLSSDNWSQRWET